MTKDGLLNPKRNNQPSYRNVGFAIYNLPQEKYDLIIGASIAKRCCLESNASPVVQADNVLPDCNPPPVNDEDDRPRKKVLWVPGAD